MGIGDNFEMIILYLTIGVITGFIAAIGMPKNEVKKDYTDVCFQMADSGFPKVSQQVRYDLVVTCLKVFKENEEGIK